METHIEKLRDFLDEIWVVCPRCRQRAIVRKLSGAQLTCADCGYIESLASVIQMPFGETVDPYFLKPIWLRIDCCGEVLWAYNPRHLLFLREFVAEKLRDVGPPGRRNLGNKLPKWMLLAKNREEVLMAISKLEKSIVE
jgi:hypothetical protein